ncbi:DUF1036 domain-containing protein [Labrys sp. (in: a-proteobacteria)]|uniref:DUF1036 domain-containing protein n=1 Tax=Labrys TaxID=204476 RepID=UPI0039E465F0
MISSSLRLPLAAAVTCLASLFAAGPAMADFRLCNNTSSRVGVAVGYRDKQGWLTEGWWNVAARSCESILKGPLAARFYYVYAVDYDQGGEWSGNAFMCSRDKEFTIRGFENCLARGYNRTGFFEIDTSEQKAWTVQLSEQAQNGAKPKSNAPADMPPAQGPSAPAAPVPAVPPASGAAPAPANPPVVTTPPVVSPAAPSPMTPQDVPAPAAPAQPAGESPNPPAVSPPAPANPPQDGAPPQPGADGPPPAEGTPTTPAPPLPPERPPSAP